MMLIGRVINGWAVGILSMSVPIYQAESAHPARRGLIIGISQQMIGLGFVVSGWMGYGCNHAPSSSTFQWRFPLAFQSIPSGLLFVGMWFFPESPRHLCAVGKYDEGLAVLRKLHFDGTNDAWINEEFMDIQTAVENEKEVSVPGVSAMFIVPQWRKRFLIACAIQVFTQTTGINVVNYYQTIMYRSLGLSGDTITLLACCYNVLGATSVLIFITFFIDKVGRRKPLLIGCIAITIVLACEGIVASQNEDGHNKALSGLGILFIWLVTVIFSASFGPISWTYMSEIMPQQIRACGVAVATSIANWGVATMWAQVSPKALGKIGWKYYFVFVAFNLFVSFPTIYFFFLETKGKTLEEMDELFGGGVVDLSRWKKFDKDMPEKGAVQHVVEVSESTEKDDGHRV
ncbi:hypothetical protein KEM56_001041 [Ascosphaera pollenicola]|nr:hypothetical protein KEM56_001041 [Ascosphaera pollenicola]